MGYVHPFVYPLAMTYTLMNEQKPTVADDGTKLSSDSLYDRHHIKSLFYSLAPMCETPAN